MTLRPYPSRSKIAAAAAQSGHVVSTEPDILRIETIKTTLTFNQDQSITDESGAQYTMDEALKALDITLT